MGVDVTLKAKVVVTDDELAAMRRRLHERFNSEVHEGANYRYPDLERPKYEDEPDIIELTTLSRFYGPAYARGHWPTIREMGDWLAVEVGERGEVRYGDDMSSDWCYLQPWPEVRTENDAFWAEHGNEPYRAGFRR